MKYFSKKVKTADGVFDSKAEYERYVWLKHQEDIGVISDLQRQIKFEVIPRLTKQVEIKMKTKTKIVERVDEMAAHYTADFCYYNADGKYVISECKGGGTLQKLADYVLRRKLIKQLIKRHNEQVGYEEWVFEEYVATKSKRRK